MPWKLLPQPDGGGSGASSGFGCHRPIERRSGSSRLHRCADARSSRGAWRSTAGQTSKPLPGASVPAADLVINMSGRPIKNFFDATPPPVEDWTVHDPFGESLEVYRRVRDDIERRVVELAGRLRASSAGAAAD